MSDLQTADSLAAASLAVALAALALAFYAIFRGNRNTSVATLVAINEAFRQAWQRYLSENDEQRKNYELAELMNLVEIACATLNEKSLAGRSLKIMSDYLNEVLKLLIDNPYANLEIGRLLNSSATFENINEYLDVERKPPLSVTIPQEWYQKKLRN